MGLSSERLKQVNALVKRHLDAKSFAGAVTLVARNGRIAHLQAHGFADLDAKQAMKTDTMFRIMSMTKPVVGVAILMMMEEGKVRLNDPVSKFIPELKGLQVAVSQPAQGPPPPPGTQAEPRYYTVPADHEITVRELLTHTSGLVSGTNSNSANRKVAIKGTESLSEYLPRLASSRSSSSRVRAGPTARGRVRRAAAHRRDHVGPAGRRVPQAAPLRSARHERHVFYPVENPRLAARHDRQPDGTLRRNASTPNS